MRMKQRQIGLRGNHSNLVQDSRTNAGQINPDQDFIISLIGLSRYKKNR